MIQGIIIFTLALFPSLTSAKTSLRTSVDAVAGDQGAEFANVSVAGLVGNLINAALSVLGVVLLVLLVYGGYTWMMAQGNEEEITKAKSIIQSAIIGLIIIMAAGAITYFVTHKLETAV